MVQHMNTSTGLPYAARESLIKQKWGLVRKTRIVKQFVNGDLVHHKMNYTGDYH